ncbi:outer membrane beta-barrel protein [Hymenobacter rubripertinctus]|uniref:Uncharacterized protein n=1 Tax=Hymenobacter rubripertinctus TaxID=2029981 RepID=A0A418QW76_9BACT|nr:outer membrane beta-barrel protein [Hymenobacter rubripertinctus]RIY09230.1 hypothetical protein D0T11_12380 [Hymenobacter rubripertinctus]
MTENDSDPFYQDLRRKLENYGSPPPESVWAGIQQQVPPPPPRWRRLAPVLLLALLLIGITATTSYWRPFFRGGRTERAAPTQAATATTAPAATVAAHHGPQPQPDALTARAGRPSNSNTTRATAASPDSDASTNSAAASNAAATESGASLPAAGQSFRQPTTRPSGRFGVVPNRRRTRTLANREASAADQSALSPGAANRRNRRPRTAEERRTAALAAARRLVVAGNRNGSQSRRRTGQGDPEARAGSRFASRRHRRTDQATQPAQPEPATSLTNEALALRPLLTPPPLAAAPAEVNRQRQPRTKRPTRQELRLRDWSVQLTGGPGLTYRLLGGSPTQLEGLERPTVSGSGQLLGAYAFSRQLTVAGGLGFAQYANSLRYTLKKTASDQTRQIDFRDVYNFVTLPVQAQLTLGGNHRWRYGVLGGGTAALLTGARTTEGSACNCGQRRWIPGSADSTFQRLNLALTVGAFANYQFAPGQWLTIRPQGQLFLNSLTQPPGTPRRPWSGGVQVGYSWDLDPHH